jgi:flagellar assembly protein FliH
MLVKRGKHAFAPPPASPPRVEDGLGPHLSDPHPQGQQQGGQPTPKDPLDEVLHQVVWSQQAIEAGLLPERRKTPRVHRRLEDRELLSAAQEEAEALKERARVEGFQEGLKEAQEASQAFWKLLDELEALKEHTLEQALSYVVPMALEVARRILKTEAACDKTLVLGMAKSLLQRVERTQKQLLFRVHPQEAALVRQAIEENPIWSQNDRELLVLEDESVELGSCCIETPAGQIDGNFSTQLETLRQLLGAAPLAFSPSNVSMATALQELELQADD